MTRKLEAIIENQVIELSGRNPYSLISITGIGLAPTRRLRERGPQQNGSSNVGFVLDERMINILIQINGDTLELVDYYRDNLAQIFKPRSVSPIKLRLTRDDNKVREIECYTVGVVDFPNSQDRRIGPSQNVVIQLEALDPIAYEPTQRSWVFGVVGGAPGGFMIPAKIPWEYEAGGSINANETIPYNGDWEEFPIITIHGYIDNLVLTNQQTNMKLDFTGHSIENNHIYTIDLRYGYKEIRRNDGILVNRTLTADSNLATWSLIPGVPNVINVESDSVNENAKIIISYFNRYISF